VVVQERNYKLQHNLWETATIISEFSMNVTIHRGEDNLQLLLLQSHELQLYNLTDSGNISYEDCILYKEAEKQSKTRVFPKEIILCIL
jgi:hypothetical protein